MTQEFWICEVTYWLILFQNFWLYFNYKFQLARLFVKQLIKQYAFIWNFCHFSCAISVSGCSSLHCDVFLASFCLSLVLFFILACSSFSLWCINLDLVRTLWSSKVSYICSYQQEKKWSDMEDAAFEKSIIVSICSRI